MRLLLIRHGKAVSRQRFAARGLDDAHRPLTKKGRRRLEDAMAGLRARVPTLGVIASSPLQRAVQTAEILSQAYPGSRIVQRRDLAPGASMQDLLRWLEQQSGAAPLAAVGHEPDLTQLMEAL